MDGEFELKSLRFQLALSQSLRQMRHPRRILGVAVRGVREFFEAEAACIVECPPGSADCEIAYRLPRESAWEPEEITPYLGRKSLSGFSQVSIAPIFRRGKSNSALVLRRTQPLTKGELQTLRRVASAVSRSLEASERERLSKVRSRIDEKLMNELRPNDLFYHILHGLRSLTRYDHSSTLYVLDEDRQGLEVRAEQIAYTKGKSRHVGSLVPVSEAIHRELLQCPVIHVERQGDGSFAGASRLSEGMIQWLSQAWLFQGDFGSLLCAPLAIGGRLIGFLRVASQHAHTFGSYESELLRRFLPLTSVAIHRAQRTESLKASVLESERKNAISNLARSVAHDVNNALGSTIPLLQQSLDDFRENSFDLEEIQGDIKEALTQVQFCRRIFAGMMAFAKATHHRSREGHLGQALERTLSVLNAGLGRRHIHLDLDLRHSKDLIPSPQADLEQLVFNLIQNAADAMPDGGELRLSTENRDRGIAMHITDSGEGIPADVLPHVQEPFYTTKVEGHGLGLAICRSIVWEMRGKIVLESERGQGTTVKLWLPTRDESTEAGEAR